MKESSNAESVKTTHRRARRPILVAIGETGGVAALRAARALAAREAAGLLVASVVEPPPIYAVEARRALLTPWTVEREIDERRQLVHDRLARFGLFADRATAPAIEVAYGEVGSAIPDLARDHGARMIIMGIGPHNVARRLIGTDSASATSRRAPCPVLAVAEHAHDLPRVAVVATDFSPESINAAIAALPLLANDATVYLVHAWTRIETVVSIGELDDLNESYAASLPQRFALMRALLKGGHHTAAIETVVVEGRPAEAILAVARDKNADLIVAGTHGYGALERWILGSTSSALLRGAQCSVLVVPEPPVAERTRLLRHMTGTSTVRVPEQWDEELRAFVRRNHDRRTTLEIDDRAIGAQVQESGFPLVGASYDPHDHHIALMFGGGRQGAPHLTRSLAHVRSVAVASGPRDEDRALCIESDHGSALLTFLDHARAAPAPDARP